MSGGDSPPDGELAARAAQGDEQAFSTLMQRHKGGLYGFVRRYVGEADASLDVVQDTFFSAWKAISRFDGRRPFGVWLRAIALNKCRDRARRQAVRRLVFSQRQSDSSEAQGQSDPAPNAEAALAASEQRRRLEAAIARLPAKLKEPLLLTYFEGLPQQQAADILGVTAKTIETRVYRARQKLAELLGPAGD